MNVCIFRHGPAVPSGTKDVAEADRPLTKRGREKTARAARGVRELDLGIRTIFSSPLPRALETAEILNRTLKGARLKTSEHLLPECPAKEILALLGTAKGGAVALVGHEPGLSSALALLLGTSRSGSYLMKKAGLAVVSVEKQSPQPQGVLELLLSPAVLRALGR